MTLSNLIKKGGIYKAATATPATNATTIKNVADVADVAVANHKVHGGGLIKKSTQRTETDTDNLKFLKTLTTFTKNDLTLFRTEGE